MGRGTANASMFCAHVRCACVLSIFVASLHAVLFICMCMCMSAHLHEGRIVRRNGRQQQRNARCSCHATPGPCPATPGPAPRGPTTRSRRHDATRATPRTPTRPRPAPRARRAETRTFMPWRLDLARRARWAPRHSHAGRSRSATAAQAAVRPLPPRTRAAHVKSRWRREKTRPSPLGRHSCAFTILQCTRCT